VVNREDDKEVKKKDDKLMEEAGEKAGEGDWARELY
jgi:hypothetical protein